MKPERPTVLVVDDDIPTLTALRRLIAAAGFRVRTFSRPNDLLSSEIPGGDVCLVLDVNLPEMNGVRLHQLLSASRRELPAIMITGRNDSQTQCLLRESRAVAVLFKPFAANLLLEALANALSMQHQRSQ